MKADSMQLLNEFIRISQGIQFVIPVYQRNYTWKRKHVNNLMDDIENILYKKNKKHFIGSVVYIVTSDIFLESEWAIVDGQQRITTIFLMLYAMRDICNEKGYKDKARFIVSNYLENANAKEDYRLRLRPQVSNDEEFKKIVEKDYKNIDSSSLIAKNFKIIRSRLMIWFSDFQIDDILSAINNLYIVYVQLDREDNAQQIFESINSTGETLKASDLIRNYILMNKKDSIQTKFYKDYWLKIEKNMSLDSIKMEEFFRFYISMKRRDLVNKKDLYEIFMKFYTEKVNMGIEEENILEEILKYSSYYKILSGNESYSGLEKELWAFDKIKSNMPIPFLMEMFDLLEDNKINISQIKECFQLINSYIIRRHMCDLDTSSITRLFPPLIKNVLGTLKGDYKNLNDVIKFFLVNQTRNKSSYMPIDDDVVSALKKKNSYVLSHTRTFFDIFEMESPIKIDYENLSVEHIMPQTPTEYWIKISDTSEEEYPYFVNLIGNLTLADRGTNSRIGNRDFETKKRELEKVGKINLSKEILTSSVWNKEKILIRTEKLANYFINLFPYFISEKNYKEISSFPIFFEKGEIKAKALLYDNKEVEILPESRLRFTDLRDDKNEEIIVRGVEEGDIVKEEKNYKVINPILLSSVSAAANFVYGNSMNGWTSWRDEDNNLLQENLRDIIENSKS